MIEEAFELSLPSSVQPAFDKKKIFILVSVFLSLSFAYVFLFPLIYAIVAISLTLGISCAFFIPLEYALFGYLFYLLFDGSFKLMTGYHPLVHVVQDIILICILLRSMLDMRSQNLNKISYTPHISMILLFSIWVILQYFNPFGLGILPSIAGSKVYFSEIIVYFLAFHHLSKESRNNIIIWIVGLATFEAVLATAEYLFFPELIYSIPGSGPLSYGTISKDIFHGALYRPMGTTALPGTPSVWMFLGAPFAIYLLLRPEKTLSTRLLALTFFIFAIPTLIFCQVRISIVLFLLSIIAVSLYPGTGLTKRFSVVSFSIVSLVALLLILTSQFLPEAEMTGSILTSATDEMDDVGSFSPAKVMQLQNRTASLGEVSTYTNARKGAWSRSVELASVMPYGIGLSRVAAAAGPWTDRIKKDPYFGTKWTFADNLFRAIFTELGVFGLVAWLVLVLTFIYSLLKISLRFTKENKNRGILIWTCSVSPFVFLLGGFDTEGIIYSPVAGVFWLMFGIGLGEFVHG